MRIIRGLRWVLVGLFVVGLMSTAFADHVVLRGTAVYHGDQYAGQTMACGGAYQPWKMVAAHRTLPCGTRLRVRNVENGRVVTVTVRDRGPFGDDDRILDLSRRAARTLRYVRAGSARVRAVVLHDD